jgi:hypothetical protein
MLPGPWTERRSAESSRLRTSTKKYRSKLTAELMDSIKTQTKMEAAIFMVSSCKFAILRYRVLKNK